MSKDDFHHIDDMLRAARAAFPAWAGRSIRERAEPIRHLREIIVNRQEEVASIIASETGRPITEVINQEITAVLEVLKFSEKAYPRWLKEKRFRYWRPGFWSKSSFVYFEPLGVFAVIGPSNFPFLLPMIHACAVLFCGNTVIIKPSEKCPDTGKIMRMMISQAQFPGGVVTVVEGDKEIGSLLIAHENVAKVIFTGAYEGGKVVAELCGRHFKECVLELGGSDPAIVCADADIERAARGIAWSGIYANGLSCVGTKRVFVLSEVAEKFLEILKDEISGIRYGNPLEPSTEIGDISDGPCACIKRAVDDAISQGAHLVELNAPVDDNRNRTNNVILLSDVPLSALVMNEEIPGPVFAIRKVGSIDQAVAEASASPFGLGASVWSGNISMAQRIARDLDVGMVWINDSSVGQPEFPWGGRKRSGWGRVLSRHGIYELTRIKIISHDRGRGRKLWWFPYSRQKYELFIATNKLVYAGTGKLSSLWRFMKALTAYAKNPRRMDDK